MKKILILISTLLIVAGCSLTSHFDNNEYASLVRMEVLARHANKTCENPNSASRFLSQLQFEAEFFHTYTKYRSKNDSTHEIAQVVLDNIKEMELRYKSSVPSTVYCVGKTELMIDTIQVGLEALDSKVKP